MGGKSRLRTVRVPAGVEDLFAAAEHVVSKYFRERKDDPEHGTIEISGERYVLLRAASLSVEFFGLVRELYGPGRAAEADEFARNILFDLAHAIGRKDAKRFHQKMGLTEPIAKLSAGPIHFAHAGWAFVHIFPESRPTPDDEYFLLYEHPYSFESDAWLRAGESRDFPVCIMNAGYSSGWCQESFGLQLVAAEVRCRARGDDTCRFVMAPPNRIEAHVRQEVKTGVSFIPDFFARKRAEEQLRQAHSELERRVVERTLALEREMEERRRVERELQRQHKLQALGRLAGGVAHDFNNLMAVVLTNGALLERTLPANDPRRRYAEEMIHAVHRAADLTRQLLAFGSTLPGERERVELDVAVANLARMLGRLIGDDVELEIDLDAPGCHILATRSEIDQVIVNLVVNARDALPAGGRIRVATERALGADVVFLRVTDSGIGMTPETQASIFDPFFTTKEGAGTGLGLSTVYGIVQRGGGSIAVESKPGEGSTFTITWPVAAPAITPPPPPDTTADAAAGRGELVLFVEDQPRLREAIGRCLHELGFRPLSASDPREALNLLEAGARPDLFLTDLMLPQMSGVELADHVEAAIPGVAVLFMSGNPSDVLDDRKARGKPVDFLPKPFTLDGLAAAVRRALDQRRSK